MMYAQVTEQGTAMAETALCHQHMDHQADYEVPGAGPYENCSGNEALECQVCGRAS